MSGGFVKIYGTILTSSVWMESASTRLVWITMLALAEQHGIVKASVPGLAHQARVSLEECEEALRVLSAPDRFSKSKDHDGRRIEEVAGGWCVLNYEAYRELRTDAQIAEAERKRQARTRPGQTGHVPDIPDVSRISEQKSEVRSQRSEAEIKTSSDDDSAQRFADEVNSAQSTRFGLVKRFGANHAATLLRDLAASGIPADFALTDTLWQVGKAREPVNSFQYFREGILTRWGEAQKRPAAGQNGATKGKHPGPEPLGTILGRGAA